MAFTTTQLTALETAIAQGALEVQYQDKKVKYHSLKEMLTLRDIIRKELGVLDDSRKPRRLYSSFTKGTK